MKNEQFCPKCNDILIPKEIKNKFIIKCDKCGFSKEVKKLLIRTEKIKPKKEIGVGVVKDRNVFATYPFKCKKCGYDKAEIIDQGVKYSDEESEVLLQCGKCDWSERINKKSS
ncbi:MAG: hypothetical protein AABY06_03850 [Nanoarchaeota archaeon]